MTTKCAGLNCTSTDGTNHSPECRAEHAAAVAGGRFVKLPRDNANPQELINLLRTFIGDTQIVRAAREAADVIEQQAARIAELLTDLERTRQERNASQVKARREIHKEYRDRIVELEALLVKANDAWMALSQTHSAAEPLYKFALIRDRNYEGEGLSLWTWNGENYSGADGDCLSPDPDGTLDGYTVEWLTDHQLDQRLNANAKDAERYRDAIATVCDGWTLPQQARKILETALWSQIAASEPKNTGN